jgi:uncharacterized repeat protein (TIGR01451 family)
LVTINGLVITHPEGGVVSGTGGYNDFLRQNATGNATASQGYNTSDPTAPGADGTDMDISVALQIGDLPIVYRDGVAYYEIRLDLNETNSGTDAGGRPKVLLGLTEFQAFVSDEQAASGDYQSTTFTNLAFLEEDGYHLVYDLDAGEDRTLILTDGPSGSGNDDYALYLPVSFFSSYDQTDYFTLFAQFGPSPAEDATFEEFRVRDVSRINGVKFSDANSNGVQDAGEAGLEGFVMYIDANDNHVLDVGEVTATSDENGNFTFYSLIAGNYIVREILSEADISTAVKADPDYDATDYLPPAGIWDLTTGLQSGPHTGDHLVTIVDGQNYSLNVGNHLLVPSLNIDKSVASVSGGDDNGTVTTTDDRVNSVGDVINYLITVENTGDVALTNVAVTDTVEGYAPTGATAVLQAGESHNIGDVNDNDILDTDETWSYTVAYTVIQADIDAAYAGNGSIDNVAVATSDQTPPDSDDAHVPVLSTPGLTIVKTVTDVDGGGAGASADQAGDVITYQIAVTNDGSVTLTGLQVTDTLDPTVTAVLQAGETHVVGDANDNDIFDVGETWIYSASYAVTQADIDAGGNYDTPGSAAGNDVIRNIATADTNQTDPESDDATVPVVQNPDLTIVKVVHDVDGDTSSPEVDREGDVINYLISVTNSGNMTLTNLQVTDSLDPTVTAVLQAGETHIEGDTNDNDIFDVGETWVFAASYTVTQADIDAGGNYDTPGSADGNDVIRNIATADTAQTEPESDDATVPVVQNPDLTIVKVVHDVDGDTSAPEVDHAGDIINYLISVTNSGNVTLTNLEVTDSLDPTVTAVLQAGETHIEGDTNDNDVFDIGETWVYAASYMVTQADIDAGGNYDTPGSSAGNDVIRNVATADTDQTDPESDDATVPVVQNPDLTIVKDVLDVDGDNTAPVVDHAGDVINYRISVTNSGNVTLTGLQVSDTLDPSVTAVLQAGETHIVGDINDNDVFDIGETWVYAASYTVTQADMDAGGNFDGPDMGTAFDLIRNIATATTNEAPPESDDAMVPVVQTPAVDLEKYVSVTGIDGTYVDADTADLGPQNVNLGAPVYFQVTVVNTGNVTLTNPVITDVNTSNGGNVNITLYDGVTDTVLAGVDFTGDDGDGNLELGETWTFTYSQPFDAGNHVNTASVTTDQGASDSDAAHYFSLVNDGPGVRTPGFWQNMKNGGQFWDGVDNNEKNAGKPCFPDDELLYMVDSNNDGTVDTNMGLLIGDYNHNGLTDADEDTLFISYADARYLINANNQQMSDGVVKIGRDIVATWLNTLAGNGIGAADDAQSPHHFIDDAIDYLQMYGDATAGVGSTTETFDVYSSMHAGVKTGTSAWTSDYPGGDHSGSEIHSALDYYNNTGMTSPTSPVYAHDCDDPNFVSAIMVYENLI